MNKRGEIEEQLKSSPTSAEAIIIVLIEPVGERLIEVPNGADDVSADGQTESNEPVYGNRSSPHTPAKLGRESLDALQLLWRTIPDPREQASVLIGRHPVGDRPDKSGARLLGERVHQPVNRTEREIDVIIEEHNARSLGLRHSTIVASAKSEIARVSKELIVPKDAPKLGLVFLHEPERVLPER
jgi:hypothetical protein